MSYFIKISVLFLVFINFSDLQAQEFISSQLKGTYTKDQLNAQYGPFFENGVKLYKILYTTPDLQGLTDTASGLILVPERPNAVMPLLCAQHGTVSSKNDVPSNLQGGFELGAVFAGVGYVTVMPDFLGLGESRGFHPYVHAESEASVSVDMLLAAREFAAQNNIALNDQLFITGYSQGGHASMALHREIEQNQSALFTVTAAAHLSGPYSISGVMRDLIIGDSEYFFPAYIPFTIISYDEAYGLFDSLGAVFKPIYASMIDKFFEGTFSLTTLNNLLIAALEQNNGASIPKYMFQDSVLNAVINDSNHPFNVALRNNDVYDWAPQAPTRIVYCTADDQVPYRNSVVADSVMNLRGAPDVMKIDANSTADHGGCVFPAVFQAYIFFNQYRNISTGIDQIDKQLDIKIYPNPTKDFITISNAPADAMVQIFDVNGRLSLTKKLNSNHISLQNLGRGLYTLRIGSTEGIWIGKVIVN